MSNLNNFINSNLDNLLTYLKAEKSSKYNHIYTTAAHYSQITTIPERNANIGLAQIHLSINTLDYSNHYSVKKYNVRLETNIFNSKLCIPAKKTVNLLKSDILLFGNDKEVYISENNNWLTDPRYYTEKTNEFSFGLYTFREYNIQKLYDNGLIKLLTNIDIYTYVCSITKGSEQYTTNKYNLSVTNNILSDPKICCTIFYGYVDDEYTDNMGTCDTIATTFARITGLKKTAIYQKLQRAKRETKDKQKSIPAKISVDANTYNNRICNMLGVSQELKDRFEKDGSNKYTLKIFVSESEDWNIWENARINKTGNIKEYQKEYQKDRSKDEEYLIEQRVRAYLRRHNNQIYSKWSDIEKEVANKILQDK